MQLLLSPKVHRDTNMELRKKTDFYNFLLQIRGVPHSRKFGNKKFFRETFFFFCVIDVFHVWNLKMFFAQLEHFPQSAMLN